MCSVSAKSTPGKGAGCSGVGWEANGSVFTSELVFQCFSEVLSSLLWTSRYLLCHDIAKQVYYTACAADGTREVLMDDESADMEQGLFKKNNHLYARTLFCYFYRYFYWICSKTIFNMYDCSKNSISWLEICLQSLCHIFEVVSPSVSKAWWIFGHLSV